MKKLFYIITLLVLLSGCDNTNYNNHEDTYDTELLNENKNTENIYGVLNLKLGVTTTKDIKGGKYNYNIQYAFLDDLIKYDTIFYNLIKKDSISKDIFLNYFTEEHYSKILTKYLKKSNIKMYFFSWYKYNDIEISNLELKFLNDTLVDINIYTDDDCFDNKNDKIVNFNMTFFDIFTDKYGKGIGHIKTNRHYNNYAKEYFTNIIEKRVWKNSKIKIEYNTEYPDYGIDRTLNDDSQLNYKLISTNIDSLLIETVKNSINEYKNIIKKEKEKELENIKSNM